jgi:hypothetical protein
MAGGRKIDEMVSKVLPAGADQRSVRADARGQDDPLGNRY